MIDNIFGVPRHARSKYTRTQSRTSEHWIGGFKSFLAVYDMPILSNIGVSYTVGKPPLIHFLPASLVQKLPRVHFLQNITVPSHFPYLRVLSLGSREKRSSRADYIIILLSRVLVFGQVQGVTEMSFRNPLINRISYKIEYLHWTWSTNEFITGSPIFASFSAVHE